MIKVVLFDFGGVLTQSGRAGFITQTLAELYDVDPDALDIGDYHYRLRRGQGDEDELFAVLNKRYGKHVTKQMFLDKVHQNFRPSREVYDLAAGLRRHGIVTGILSNVFAMNAEVLQAQGWYKGFEPVILSCYEGHAKPDSALYEAAIAKVGVDPSEILFVDDQPKCLGPALALGMSVVAANDPSQIVRDVTAIMRDKNKIDLARPSSSLPKELQ